MKENIDKRKLLELLGYHHNCGERILDHLFHSVVITDLDGKILLWNQGSEILFGYSKEEIAGKKASILYTSDQIQSFKTDLKKIKNGEVIKGPRRGKHKDGSIVWFEIYAQILKDRKGIPIALIGSVQDVASLRKTERKLKESRARASAIMAMTAHGIISFTTEGIIEDVNRAIEHIFGYSKEDLIGKNIEILLASHHQIETVQNIDNYLTEEKNKLVREGQGRRKNGTLFPMELTICKVNFSKNNIYTSIIRDISERRELEKKIIEISDEERMRIGQSLHDNLGQMLTAIELKCRNLLTKIKNSTDELADEMQSIIDWVVEADDYTRTLAREVVPFDLISRNLKEGLFHMCRRIEKLYNITCELIFKTETDFSDKNIAVHLYHIAQEAISNAVKHGKADYIRIILKDSNKSIKLIIKDNGTGFSKSPELAKQEGMGIQIMQYRAHLAGGKLDFPETDDFTQIVCTIPKQQAEEKTT